MSPAKRSHFLAELQPLPDLVEPRVETIIERAARTGEPLKHGSLLDLIPPRVIREIMLEALEEPFKIAFRDEIARAFGVPPETIPLGSVGMETQYAALRLDLERLLDGGVKP